MNENHVCDMIIVGGGPGGYGVGDVRTELLRLVVTAVADGAMAAHMAEEYLAGGVWCESGNENESTIPVNELQDDFKETSKLKLRRSFFAKEKKEARWRKPNYIFIRCV